MELDSRHIRHDHQPRRLARLRRLNPENLGSGPDANPRRRVSGWINVGANRQLTTSPVIAISLTWRILMRNMILAAFAVLSLTAAIVPAANAKSTIAGDAQATRQQQTGSYSQ
jgi:hypothetical protein